MYIKTIVLDGFKSYRNRVVFLNFDPAINAITGLSSAGKSTVIDAICFVLGITNLHNTPNLLNYGCNKDASVSITFDNGDTSRSPMGHERDDEITVTRMQSSLGNDRYIINGTAVPQETFNELFSSVHLDDPYLVVAQGYINHILKMHPAGILSLIEEAAGINTRDYQTLKDEKKKKDKNRSKLEDEINEQEPPNFQRLQYEQAQFEEYQNITRERNNTYKLHEAYRYFLNEKNYAETEQQIPNVVNDTMARKGHIRSYKEMSDVLEKELRSIKKLEEKSSDEIDELKKKLSEVQSQEISAAMDLREAEAYYVAFHDTKSRRERRYLQENQAVLQIKRAQADQAAESFSGLRATSESSTATLKTSYDRFKAVCSNLENKLRQGWGVQSAARNEAGSRASYAALDLEAYEVRLQKLRAERAGYEPAYAQDQAALAECERRRRDLQSEVPYDAARHAALAADRRALEDEVRAQRGVVDVMAARLQRCHFRYDPPDPNFDEIQVHGTIAQLIEKSDPVYYTALETVAGDKLYSVVVDTMQTASLLRKRGNLGNRLIPLNTIRGTAINAKTVAAAQEIGGGADAVQLALSLVPSEAALEPALKWVFGKTLVCRDLETALLVYCHPRVRCRCVTLNGDICDLIDGGTVTSGGARSRGPSTVQQLAALHAAEDALQHHERRLQAVDAELAVLKRASEHYHYKQMLDMELQGLAARVAGSMYTCVQTQIEGLEAQVSEKRSAMQRDSAAQQEAAARDAQLEGTAQGYQETLREYEKAKAALLKAYEVDAKHGTAWRGPANELEVADLEATVKTGRGALEAAKDARSSAAVWRDKYDTYQDIVAKVHRAQGRFARRKAQMALLKRSVHVRKERKDALRVAARDAELRCTQLFIKLKELHHQINYMRFSMARLIEEQPWIVEEKHLFGQAGGPYDFVALDAAGASARLDVLNERFYRLNRVFNLPAYRLYSQKAERYLNLLRKRADLDEKRYQLMQAMRLLRENRRTALRSAMAHFNRLFGAIYADLLPGGNARVEAQPDCDVLDGLECVAFTGTWKKSMEQMSYREQSLVVLAFVLALLRYQPAPLFMLDEVDVSLSQYQNIDLVLRDHFPHSQFIMVTKSAEMCNYANVVFRVTSGLGISVERTVNDDVPEVNNRARERQARERRG